MCLWFDTKTYKVKGKGKAKAEHKPKPKKQFDTTTQRMGGVRK